MADDSKNISINITTGAIVKILLLMLLFYVLYLLKDLVLVVLTAVVIASSVEPAAKWFARYKIPRVPAVIFVYASTIALFIGVFYFFIPPLLDEASKFASVLPQYLESATVTDKLTGNDLSGAQKIVGGISNSIPLKDLILQAKNTVTGLSGGAFEAVARIFGGVFSFLIIVVISFYLSVQRNGISNFLKLIAPIKQQDYIVDLWTRSQIKIGRWFQGQLLLGLIIGVLVYLGLTILEVPYAILLAILAAIFEIIPVFGPILAAIPAIALGFTISATVGAMTLALYLIIQQFENHLIYPLVVRKVIGVPPILVILALIIGWELAGFLGVLLSVPIAAVLIEFTNDVAKEKHIT
jgi:predicted PurR-regulated permease PerM